MGWCHGWFRAAAGGHTIIARTKEKLASDIVASPWAPFPEVQPSPMAAPSPTSNPPASTRGVPISAAAGSN